MDEILARELVAAANRMHDSLTLYQTDVSLGHQGSRDLLIQCATTGCSLLNNDVYVQAFVDDARMLKERASNHQSDIQVITSADHFEFFLRGEAYLLEQAGTNPSLIAVILELCRDTREAASPFDAEDFRGALGELRHAVCGVLTELRETTFDQRRSSRLFRRLVVCLMGVCGCVVVGLDASTLAATLGLSAAGSAVSGAVGGTILSQAITELSTDPTRRDRPGSGQ